MGEWGSGGVGEWGSGGVGEWGSGGVGEWGSGGVGEWGSGGVGEWGSGGVGECLVLGFFMFIGFWVLFSGTTHKEQTSPSPPNLLSRSPNKPLLAASASDSTSDNIPTPASKAEAWLQVLLIGG